MQARPLPKLIRKYFFKKYERFQHNEQDGYVCGANEDRSRERENLEYKKKQ